MPYYVTKSGKTWQLIFRYGSERARNIPKKSEEASKLGFSVAMSLEDARVVAKRLQAEAALDREARARGNLAERRKKSALLRSAFLTDLDASEFEAKYLREHKIRDAHWTTMQKVIVGVAVHPSEWFDLKQTLYGQFLELRLSFNYAKKLLRYLNIWGYYLCKKQGKAWKDLPGLDGTWKNRLEAKRKPGRRPSKPLDYPTLRAKRATMEPEHYGWVLATVAFGLRPEEADQLSASNPERWRVYHDPELKREVLALFQKKLVDRGVPPDDCWKHIPAVEPEQVEALDYVKRGEVKRPRGQGGLYMRNTFGEGYSYYAGRNNFSGWLRDLGYDQEVRRRWMGHLSSTTTDRYDRKTSAGKVFYKAPTKQKAG